MSGVVACFGEIMARIQPEGFYKIRQAFPGKADISFAGAEANVAASLQMLGREARYVSALPVGPLGDAAMDAVRRFGIDTRYILRGQGRLGLYFVERGANQRASAVIYDRAGALVCETDASVYDWSSIFSGCSWFHISGITPAISRKAAEASILAVENAKAKGLTVSCDLNFRKKLWTWEPGTAAGKLAEKIMGAMLPFVDVVIGNEEDAEEVFGIRAEGTNVETGTLAINRYPEVASKIADRFPNVGKVAITLRESHSASHNNWGAMLYDAKTHEAEFAPMKEGSYCPYEIRNIVDRIGGGDAFAAGLVFALTEPSIQEDQAATIAFASAASCLCHSIEGDFNYVTKVEILDLMNGDASGRVRR
jgi:2-dehydro-3-deoxygluconokinase